MRRRRYSEEYQSSRQTYSPDINHLEQFARAALELQKLLGVENLDDRYFDSTNRHNENCYDKFYSLCISKIPHRLSESDIRDAIYHECKYCGDFNVKISLYNGERVAYINFRSSRQAAKASDGLKNFKMDSKTVRIEPVVHNNGYYRSPRSARSRSPPYVHSQDNYCQTRRRGNESLSPVRHNRRRSVSRTPPKESKPSQSGKDLATVPTRTLFIGNLPLDMTEVSLKELFGQYGTVTDIDIKKPATSRQTSSYAFIKFENLDMANRAKECLSGRTIGRCQIKIGFGKVSPTSCVWVGGLGPWLLYDTLEAELRRFGAVKQLEWPHGKDHAYVLFESVDVAIAAVSKLRGAHLCKDKKRPIRVDFADVGVVRRSVAEVPERAVVTTPAASDRVSVHSSRSVQQLLSCLADVWTGMVVLKNNNFGCRLYALEGDRSMIGHFMSSKRGGALNEGQSRVDNLTITQRMRLDSHKLAEISQRIEAAGESGFCLMLASSYVIDTKLVSDSHQPQRPLKSLITYLRTKESAGVIFLKSNHQPAMTGVLHAFPPCDFSFQILVQKAPNLTKDFLKDDFLVVLLIKNAV